MVSGKRNRYTKNGYNLDLTYITDRVIACSYPASGIEATYRNKIGDVLFVSYFQLANFLDGEHKNDYKIYNLSGRLYDDKHFSGKVFDNSNIG